MSDRLRFEPIFLSPRWAVMDNEATRHWYCRNRDHAYIWARELNKLVAKGLPVTLKEYDNEAP